MEKIIIRKWEDLEKAGVVITYMENEVVALETQDSIHGLKLYLDCCTNDIERVVNILNAAVNFELEYQYVEIIDDQKSFDRFLKKLVDYDEEENTTFYYDLNKKDFISFIYVDNGYCKMDRYSIEKIEELFSVDLKIIK